MIELKDERLAICKRCEHYWQRAEVAVCRLCGCQVATKAAFESGKCPEGKWDQP